MQERKVSQAPDLFSPAEVGLLGLKNRAVMAPLTRSRAGPGNVPTQLNALYYAQRASAGLIIAEATQIPPEGQGYISSSMRRSYRSIVRRSMAVGNRATPTIRSCARLRPTPAIATPNGLGVKQSCNVDRA